MECSNEEYSRKSSEKIIMRHKHVRKTPLKTLHPTHRSLKFIGEALENCVVLKIETSASLFSLNCSVGTVSSTFSTPRRKNNPFNTEIPKLRCCEKSFGLNPALPHAACLRQWASTPPQHYVEFRIRVGGKNEKR